MGLAGLALAVSLVSGWFALEAIWGAKQHDALGMFFRVAVAGGLGLLISSWLYLLCLTVGRTERPWIVAADMVGLFFCVALARGFRARRHNASRYRLTESPAREEQNSIDGFLAASLAIAVVANAGIWLDRFRLEPLGFWDAFAIWNLKARFFFLDAGAHWRRAFSDIITWSHTDYPLLLPLNVARLWSYGGNPDSSIAAGFSLYAMLLVLSLLIGGVAALHSRRLGYLAALALLATPGLMLQAHWQMADIPMSFFVAASLALVLISPKQKSPTTCLLLAGVMAGAAAWTKNEGLLFGLVMVASIALLGSGATLRERVRPVPAFLTGFAVPVALVLILKISLGGESDLANDFTGAALLRVFEGARHQMIAASFGRSLVLLVGVPLLSVLLGIGVWVRLIEMNSIPKCARSDIPLRVGILALGLQLTGYYFIYLITDRDLAWHLGTSNLRLFVQLWPSALLLLFTAFRPLSHSEPEATQEN